MDKNFLGIVADVLKTNSDKLTENSTIQTIPEWDSLTHWAIIGKIEDTYGIEFTMDEAADIKTLGDLYNTLIKKL